MRAIASVSNKTGLVPFFEGLQGAGLELYSTGGTKKVLQDGGIAVHGISDLTGFPEILDGRVKTLHPKVYGGLLALRDRADPVTTHGWRIAGARSVRSDAREPGIRQRHRLCLGPNRARHGQPHH